MADGFTPSVDAALKSGATEWRYAIRLNLIDGDVFFVADTRKAEFDGLTYNPVPHARISNLTTKTGEVSNKATITLDGSLVKKPDEFTTKSSWFSGLIGRKLVKRQLDVFILHYDISTMMPIGRTLELSGFVHTAKVTTNSIGEPEFILEALSWRMKMRDGAQRVYSPTDQQLLYANDTALDSLAEAVNRQGKVNWDDRYGAGE